MYHFTTCGKTKNKGPSPDEASNYYSNSNVTVTVYNGIQEWIVPYSGFYLIEASGASGSTTSEYSPGKGVVLSSIFLLTQYTKLYILVGQKGETENDFWGGSGGGATFIAQKELGSNELLQLDDNRVPVKLLLAAAGGGGTGDVNTENVNNEDRNGKDGNCPVNNIQEGFGQSLDGYGGAGYTSNSIQGGFQTMSFLNGGEAAEYAFSYPLPDDPNNIEYGYGGFGGGGLGNDGGGGGAGYKGGDGGEKGKGGNGGYSFSSRKVIACEEKNEGSGYANIHILMIVTGQYKTDSLAFTSSLFAISLLSASY